MKLVIVESPTKARKLAGYLGPEFQVEASVGHVRDLPKSSLGIDVDHDFEPTYEVDPEKKKVISTLKKYAKQADTIVLATDPDREGEAIAWHIQYLLAQIAGKKEFVRATFHEITKQAVLDAIGHPGKINQELVDAQQARRVVDRLVGYQLSPVLWKKVRRGLSAGRVQSVALRLIVEREREIEAFKPDEYWEVDVALAVDQQTGPVFVDGKLPTSIPANMLIARVIEVDQQQYSPTTQAVVDPVTDKLAGARYQVKQVEKKQRKRVSLPPFTTSTLQQTAATRLGFTSKQTMRLAQQLYEEGLITYHRTDSVALSQQSLEMARQHIQHQFGVDYLPVAPRYFRSNAKNAQEAHEAIRVTDVFLSEEQVIGVSSKFTQQHQKLYSLIWRRFVASQMQEAVYDQTTILIGAQATSFQATLKTTGSILKFDGWMRLFPAGDDVIIPDVTSDQVLNYIDTNAAQKFTQPPARYNDASLVKELEKRGIGRPSTYASIISVIEDRGYVTRDAKRFVATPVGTTVSDFLLQHFASIMDYDFTAEMEEDLDRIALGKKEWRQIVSTFYKPLAKQITEVTKTADRAQIPVEKTGQPCPTCGSTDQGEVVIRSGRFGKFKSCSRYPDCDFTENLVEKLADRHCPLCKEGDVIIRKSRWGKPFYGCSRYPQCDWASWGKPDPNLSLTTEEWATMQAARKAKAAARKSNQKKPKKTVSKAKKKKKKS